MKVLNAGSQRDQRTLFDVDFALTPDSTITWFGFSEEGQLFALDSDGILRSFSFSTQTWTPRLDFKQRYPEAYRDMWLSGISE